MSSEGATSIFGVLVEFLPLALMLYFAWRMFRPRRNAEGEVVVEWNARTERRYRAAYYQVWRHIRDHHLYREKVVDWDARKKPSRKWSSRFEAECAMYELVKVLEDKHSYVLTGSSMESREKDREKKGVVESRMLPGNIGYLKLSTFMSEYAASEMAEEMVKLNAAQALILDLRDNRGGQVSQCFKIFSLFVKGGHFSTLKSLYRGEEREDVLTVTDHRCEHSLDCKDSMDRYYDLSHGRPLVVLVNKRSASASEMLSGSLKSRPLTAIVGTSTYGKGVGQIPHTFKRLGLSVSITTMRFFAPNGECPQDVGVKPDLLVRGGRRQMRAAYAVLNEMLSRPPLVVPDYDGQVVAKSEKLVPAVA